MRLPALLATTFAATVALAALAAQASLHAQAAPHLLFSAEVDPGATSVAGGSCPVLLHLHNVTREPASMVGRIEGRLGDDGFPSFRTFSFDNVRPGSVATQPLTFDGDCRDAGTGGAATGSIVFRGLLMCHEGLTNYLNCANDIGAERSGGRAIDVVIDVRDWDPGGIGTPGDARGPNPGR